MISIEEIILLSLLKISIVGIREELALSYNFKQSNIITITTKDKNIEIRLKENGNYVSKKGNELKARPYFPFRGDLNKIRKGEYSRLSEGFRRYCLSNSGVNRDVLRKIFYPSKQEIVKEIASKMPNLPEDKRELEALETYDEMMSLGQSFELYKPLIKNDNKA